MNRKLKMITQVTLLCLLVAVTFNNCGQPGALELKETVEKNSDIQGLPPDPPSTPEEPEAPTTPSYVLKESYVDVNEITSQSVDILMVIDNSQSMAFEQKNMANRFSDFIDQLQGLDWRVAIITTDVSEDKALKDGRLIPFSGLSGKTYVDSSMDLGAVKQAFANTIQRPEFGSGYEQGIRALYRAVERSQSSTQVNAPNKSFFRSNAALSIVVVTDANETPNGTPSLKNDPKNLLSLIKTTWPQKSLTLHSIVVKTGDPNCLQSNGNESYGKAYELASSLTDGIIGTVCANDYGQQLQIIGESTRQSVNTLTLQCKPVDANQDGEVDLEVIGPDGQKVLNGFDLVEAQIKFDSLLPVGRTTARYNCLL